MASEPIQKTFISAQSLLQDSFELGRQVFKSGFRPTFLVGVWRGGAPIGITVQEVLEYHGVNCDHIAIRTSSYTGIDQQSRAVRVHAIDYLVSMLNADDGLLLIDDVFWLVFPHEICGLTREEIMKHKPVSADFLPDGV